MKDLPLTLLLLALAAPALPAQEAEGTPDAHAAETPSEAPAETPADTTSAETPAETHADAASADTPSADAASPETTPADAEPAGDTGAEVTDTTDDTATEKPSGVTFVEPDDAPGETPAEDIVDAGETPDGDAGEGSGTEPAPLPGVITDIQADIASAREPGRQSPVSQETETQICEGLVQLRSLGEMMARIQSVSKADEGAKALQNALDGIRKWQSETAGKLQDPACRELYDKRYRKTAEEICLAIAGVSINLVDADYLQSDDLRQTILRISKELPQAFGLRENAVLTCSGIIQLAMLDQALACTADERTAEKQAPRIAELTEALQGWRKAARPEGADHATRRHLKSYRSFIERENLRIGMQLKRISYANHFNNENLSAAAKTAADSIVDICALPKEEQHICDGIILLGVLENILAQVKDSESARAATAPIMRISTELQQWGQDFAALPDPDEATIQRYEKRYLPRIEQLNDRIKAQGARIASAEFYRSRELPAALLRLIMNFQ